VQIVITSPPGEIDALYSWLRADRDVALTAEISAGISSDSTSMNALEVINVVLTHVAATANLALAFDAWRRTRAHPKPVTIKRPDGQILTIDAGSDIAKDAIIEFLSNGSTPQP